MVLHVFDGYFLFCHEFNNLIMRIFARSLYVFYMCILICSQVSAQNNNEYTNSMVVCAYPDAAKVGVDILKKGGNAIDVL